MGSNSYGYFAITPTDIYRLKQDECVKMSRLTGKFLERIEFDHTPYNFHSFELLSENTKRNQIVDLNKSGTSIHIKDQRYFLGISCIHGYLEIYNGRTAGDSLKLTKKDKMIRINGKKLILNVSENKLYDSAGNENFAIVCYADGAHIVRNTIYDNKAAKIKGKYNSVHLSDSGCITLKDIYDSFSVYRLHILDHHFNGGNFSNLIPTGKKIIITLILIWYYRKTSLSILNKDIMSYLMSMLRFGV